MKKWIWLSMLPLVALAGTRDDYASQWPLTLQREDAGAYRVVLTPEVYLQLQSAQAQDLQVIDADGQAVATALVAPDQPLALPVQKVQVPRFRVKLPQREGSDLHDLSLVAERDSEGNIHSIRTQVSLADAPASAGSAWLIDTSRIHDAVAALEFAWPQTSTSFELAYRLEGSDDLRDWRVLDERVQLIDLVEQGQRLQRNRVAVGEPMRYLRMVPLQRDDALPELSVSAELRPQSKVADWRWVELSPESRSSDGKGISYLLQGRFPVERAEVSTSGNAVVRWTSLSSRDSTVTEKNGPLMNPDAVWQHRAGPWLSYQLTDQGQRVQSAPETFAVSTRDRYWNLLADQAIAGESPRLRLGYRPETVVFVAQGRPPYSLVAGSVRAQRQDAPLPELIDAMRKQRGDAWQPAEATLGAIQPLAGAQALQPVPQSRDWKTWLLWGLLVAGALVVAGFALSLLRQKPAA